MSHFGYTRLEATPWALLRSPIQQVTHLLGARRESSHRFRQARQGPPTWAAARAPRVWRCPRTPRRPRDSEGKRRVAPLAPLCARRRTSFEGLEAQAEDDFVVHVRKKQEFFFGVLGEIWKALGVCLRGDEHELDGVCETTPHNCLALRKKHARSWCFNKVGTACT